MYYGLVVSTHTLTSIFWALELIWGIWGWVWPIHGHMRLFRFSKTKKNINGLSYGLVVWCTCQDIKILSLGANLRNVGLNLACSGSQTPIQNFQNWKKKRSEPWLSSQRTCSNINILSFGAHLENVRLSLAYSCACSELPKLTCLPVLSLTIKRHKNPRNTRSKVKSE